jgi:hypothetical protein
MGVDEDNFDNRLQAILLRIAKAFVPILRPDVVSSTTDPERIVGRVSTFAAASFLGKF